MGLIGSAIGAAGSIFGGISASKAMKRAKKNVEAQRQKNQDWYDRRYNEDATQRADAQRILAQTEESIKQRNKQAAGSAAVMGGTDESVAAAKAANNQALADATSQIAANAEARKDNINKQAAGSAAVMGGTDESVAAAKAANNQALADATSQIAANAEARKDNIEATYMANDNAFVEQLNQLEQGKAQAIGQAVQGVANAASSMPF